MDEVNADASEVLVDLDVVLAIEGVLSVFVSVFVFAEVEVDTDSGAEKESALVLGTGAFEEVRIKLELELDRGVENGLGGGVVGTSLEVDFEVSLVDEEGADAVE